MNNISPLAWAIIIIFGLFIVGLNYGLIAALRDGKLFQAPKMPKSRADQALKSAGDLIRDPFREEKRQIDQLSSLVNELKEPLKSPGREENDQP